MSSSAGNDVDASPQIDAPIEVDAVAAAPEGPGPHSLTAATHADQPLSDDASGSREGPGRSAGGDRPPLTIDGDSRSFLRPDPSRGRTGIAERMRGVSIRARMLLLTAAAMVFSAAIAASSAWGIQRSAGYTSEMDTLAEVAGLNATATEELRRMSEVADAEVAAAGRRIDNLAARLDAMATQRSIRQVVNDARRTSRVYETARISNRGPADEGSAFRSAESAFAAVDVAIAERRRDLASTAERVKARSVIALGTMFALGALVLAAMGHVVARSVVRPVTLLGRSLRRFGEGDLFARASEASDEVGTLARSFNSMASTVSDRVRQLNAVAERGTQLRMISDALDLADREPDVYRILDRAFGILAPDMPGELLLNELTSPRLWPVSANPSAGAAGCPVANTEGCVAMRRGQPVVFESPTAINACPQLRNHRSPCSAACVPVSLNGQLLGVVHVTAAEHSSPEPEIVQQLVMLAGQVGSRLGAMRTLETSRLEASTDGLTGLPNRRMLEARLGDLVRGRQPFALAVADLDRFKQLNDTYGHEIGDRALQVFSKVLHDNVRGHDLVARYGGEEFVLVFPELSVAKSMEVIERIRLALAGAIEINGLPQFSSSFGVTHSSTSDSVEGVIRIADAGLLTAKDLGRNRVVFADQDMAIEVFGSRWPDTEAADTGAPEIAPEIEAADHDGPGPDVPGP